MYNFKDWNEFIIKFVTESTALKLDLLRFRSSSNHLREESNFMTTVLVFSHNILQHSNLWVILLSPTQYRLNFRFINLEVNVLIIHLLNEAYIKDNDNGFALGGYVTYLCS